MPSHKRTLLVNDFVKNKWVYLKLPDLLFIKTKYNPELNSTKGYKFFMIVVKNFNGLNQSINAWVTPLHANRVGSICLSDYTNNNSIEKLIDRVFTTPFNCYIPCDLEDCFLEKCLFISDNYLALLRKDFYIPDFKKSSFEGMKKWLV